jgi:transmembrane sensor
MDATDRKKRASAEAAEWFVRLQSDDLSRETRAQFVSWLLESHVHVAELLRISQVHGALEQFERWSRISTQGRTGGDGTVIQLASVSALGNRGETRQRREGSLRDEARRPPSRSGRLEPDIQRRADRRKNSRKVRLSMAAAAMILFSAAAMFLPQVRGKVIDTERGERREVVLSDGSVIQVDPETRLRVKYSERVRRVFLERGRALFHVAKNKDRPFLVDADGTTVRAVGTAFGVDRQSRGLVITVAEGKVSVAPTEQIPSTLPGNPGLARERGGSGDLSSDRGSQSARGGAATGNDASPTPAKSSGSEERSAATANDALLLNANQQVTVEHSGSAESVRAVDSYRELAWAQGRLIFENDDVDKVIVVFNRYNRVQLRVTGTELGRRPVSGVFNAAEPEAFIAFLQTVAPVRIVRDGDRSITIESIRDR